MKYLLPTLFFFTLISCNENDSNKYFIISEENLKDTKEYQKKLFDEKDWRNLHLQIIFYGRAFCTAQGCDGTVCFMCKSLYPNRKTKIKTTKA